MAYQKPQAIIHQQFEVLPKITEDEMRAVIVGPSAILHRYADADEKIDIFVGIYNPFEDIIYQYPGIKAGGIVDTAYSKLYVDNALLSYFDSNVDRMTHVVKADEVEVSNVATKVYLLDEGPGSTLTAESATKATADDFKVVYTQKVNEEGLPLYVTAVTISGVTTYGETTDVSDSTIAKYDDTDIPIKVYTVYRDGSGAVAYQTEDGTVTFGRTFAANYTANDPIEALIVSQETAERKKYKFYNDYSAENTIISDTFNFRDAIAPRAAELGIRDVAVGDYVEISGSAPDENGNCVSLGTFVTRIIGFSDVDSLQYIENFNIVQPENTTAVEATLTEVIGSTTSDTNTLADIKSGSIDCVKYGFVISGESTDTENGKVGCVIKIAADKVVEEGNCVGTLWFKITSSSTGENRSVQIKPTTEEFKLSDYGDVIISLKEGAYASIVEKVKAGIPVTWKYKVAQKYVQFEGQEDIVIGGIDEYTGPDDTYILTCTEGCVAPSAATGNIPATGAKFTITTINGRENLKGVTFTPDYWTASQTLGTQGLTIQLNSRTDDYKGITAGTQITFDVVASKSYRINGIKLADDLPENMRSTATDPKVVDIKLLFKDNIELPAISPVTGTPNWEQEDTVFTVFENASTINPDFATVVYNDDGTVAASSNIPLYLIGYGNDPETLYTNFSKIYFNYREWSPIHASNCSFCESVQALDDVIGPLDPDNPLKWAVYKALTNSDGASVAYVAVKDPNDLDDWQDAISIIEGRDDVYTIVPLTTDVKVQNLVVALVNSESAAEACRWKTALFNMDLPVSGMVIGKNENNATNPTSSDGKEVLCKITNNTLNAANAFTKVTCVSGNARFIDYGVRPGDELRKVDSQGNIVSTHTVDQVFSNGTLTVVEPFEYAENKAIIEVWHTYTRAEEVELIRDRAQSFASRRIGLVWPDIVTEGGLEEPGYYLSAALAGLKSGVEPQQGLTRRTIQGFDGFTRSKPRYTESQLDLMASSGVWICVEDSDGTPQSRHALTTSTINTFYSEEMMTRNFDSVSKYMYQVIDTYIGVYNVTDETLRSIYYNLRNACEYLMGKGQMINYTNITVKQHDLLLDRVVAYIDCGLPFAVNNVELFITAQAYKLDAVTIQSMQEEEANN